MRLSPGTRKLALTAHIACSAGWIGAVLCFVALAAIGLADDDPGTVRGVYLVMEPTAWAVLAPLAVASFVTGLVQALGSTWGLFRHYWVVFKLLINVVATVLLLTYMETFEVMASAAADPEEELETVRNASPLLHALVALVLLIVAATLAVYKPRGLTPYGRRKLVEQPNPKEVSRLGAPDRATRGKP